MTVRLAPVLLLVAAATGAIHAQRFTARADAVRVDVLVTDGRRPVAGLTAADFEVRDNGVVQDVRVIEHERLPLNVICVFDTSGSVAGFRLQRLVTSGMALVDGVQTGDRLALLTFGSRVRLHAPLSTEPGPIRSAFARLSASGRTLLRDGVFAGLALREDAEGRTLLLLFSDGYDTGSWISPERLISAAARTDVVIYSVAVSNPRTDRHGRLLEQLSEETGGRVLPGGWNRDLQATFARILNEFRDRYVLSYAPPSVPAPGWHRIEVSLRSKRGRVTARRGYFVQ